MSSQDIARWWHLSNEQFADLDEKVLTDKQRALEDKVVEAFCRLPRKPQVSESSKSSKPSDSCVTSTESMNADHSALAVNRATNTNADPAKANCISTGNEPHISGYCSHSCFVSRSSNSAARFSSVIRRLLGRKPTGGIS